MKGFLVILALSCFLGLSKAQNGTEVIISLFATDLTGCDDLSACDTFVKIMCSSTSSDWKECGKTAEIGDDNYPLWPERFRFNYVQAEHQQWKFNVIDADVLFDDPIGDASTSMEDFLREADITGVMRFELKGRGYLYVQKRVF